MSGPSGMTAIGAPSTQPYTEEILKALNIDRSNPRRLQEVPAEALFDAREKAIAAARMDGSRPMIDGRHFPAAPMTPEGLAVHADIPLLLGTVDTESTSFLASDLRNFSVTADQVRARIKDEFAMDDAAAQALMDAYQQAEPGRTPADVLIGIASDSLFRAPIIRGADAKADARQAPVHLYNVAWHAPVDGGIYRAPHTIDIPLAFGNTAASAALTGTGPEQAEVSRNVLSSFVAFARTGNPNNDRVPEWPAYETATRPTMSFDVQCQIVPDLRGGDRVAIGTLQTRSNSGPLHTYR